MTGFLDFLDLIRNEVVSLLEVVPPYISSAFITGATISIILALKRVVID